MSQLKLRDYQRECIDAVFNAWGEGVRRPAVVLPTGAGKTVVFSHLIKRWREPMDVDDPTMDIGSRVIVLVHRDELADQAMDKLRAIAPELSVGKVKASVNEITADVMVCSVQTLASQKRRNDLLLLTRTHGDVGLIITDECHHAAAPSYKKVYESFPDALQLGVTATMARGDGVGLGSTWEEVVYTKSILWMISKNYLTDVRTQRVVVDNLELNNVGMSRGDYKTGVLGDALHESGAMAAIPRAYLEHAGDRSGVVFTPTVETAHEAAKELESAGVRTAVISGETPREERQQIYDDFRNGVVQVLSNCMVLTEGFDAPWASCAVIARPTQSAPLYTQMVGRVLRPYPGKVDALVLDLVGASSHKLRTLVDLEPGVVHAVRDGETLAEAAIREGEERNKRVPAGSIAFELKLREVNMFEGSDVAWSRTPGGVLFIECGKNSVGNSQRVFLWPSPDQLGLWDVCRQEDGERWVRSEQHRGLDLGSAMAWGEVEAEEAGSFSVRRSARWRKQPATEAQARVLLNLGVAPSRYETKGEASAAISMAIASQVFDGYVKRA